MYVEHLQNLGYKETITGAYKEALKQADELMSK